MSNSPTGCAVDCPQCGKRLQIPATHLGKQGRCPNCKHVFLLQAPAEAPLAEVATPAAAIAAPTHYGPLNPAALPAQPWGPSAAAPAPAPYPPQPSGAFAPSPFGAAQAPFKAPLAAGYAAAAPSPFAPTSYGVGPLGPAPGPYGNIPSPFGTPGSASGTSYGMASLPAAGYSDPEQSPSAAAGSGDDMTVVQRIGIVVFVITSGFTALNAGGFMGPPMWFPLSLLISTVGGVIGGIMLAPTHRWAGAIGGFIAGPLGLVAIAMYVQGRQQVWNVELVIVQCVACLPGLGVYYGLKKLVGG